MVKYNTNFVRGTSGNILPLGENLTISISGSPVYILGRLLVRQSFGRKKLIQIEQSGSRQNPDTASIKFEMAIRSKGKIQSMPIGNYRVESYAYFTESGGRKWGDNFEIE